MFDDNNGQERRNSPIHHEMSETPFGASVSQSRSEEPEQPVQTPGASDPTEVVEPAQSEQPVAEAEAEEPVEEQAAPVEEPMTMEAAMAASAGQGVDYSGTFKTLTEGDVVDGVVVHIDREGVLVDVGTKSEGMIRPNELTRDPSLEPEQVVSVGEKIKVYVVEADSQDGGPVLSKKRADFENAWERVEKAHATGEVLKAMVTDRVKGGLVVDLGIRGFVPASHVGSGKLKNLEKFIGQSMPFKVIEVDRERRKVVLSNRAAAEQERESLRKETVASLAEGQIREGIVRRITDYGAFVDLGGVDGLLHISEMSWTRINHPSEVVKVGQKIQVMILKLNLKEGRVSLGLRQILPDPWEDVKRLYRVGEVTRVTISRLVPFGAFVHLEGGVEGIIPNSELAVRRINKPEEVVSVGDEVEAKVIDLRPEERRMTLSVKQLHIQKEREREDTEVRAYSQSRQQESRTTIGDLIGEQLENFAASVAEPGKAVKQPRKKTSRARARKEELEEAEALAEIEKSIEEETAVSQEPEVAAAAVPEEPAPETAPEAEAAEVEAPVAEPETVAAAPEAVEVEAVPEAEEAVQPEKPSAEETAAEQPEMEGAKRTRAPRTRKPKES